ncbi:exonuclease SbcCD subunit D [Vallitalea guaymasensis]|uniref:exonuclease SbcCD subunit D n=1 Tax=Vallitalea guaymasensis TaxID=1185412 RepID=UPI000DE45ADC|nr:exonuclease SbcCD subunit D [Vallitalea guaymasensis]
MKILHTGDWHIGKLVHGIHMTEDQKYILKQLVELIDQEKPDVLIIAGDIYDRSVPPIEAVDLLDEVLSDIVMKHKTKIIAIAGNHDSPDRVGFGNKLLRDNGLYISGNLTEEIEPICIEDEFGGVNFYPIPFVEPAIVRELYNDESIKNHDMAMKAILSRVNEGLESNSRNICVAHAFVMGTVMLETSESERPLSIGGSEYVNVDYFEKFNYVALGHLHRPQKVMYDHIRYSGSLLKYSFSETTQNKSITLISMDSEGNISVDLRELSPIRDMRIIKGKLENLTDKDIYSTTNTDDYIMATITDRDELIDPIGVLRGIYPNILRLEKEQLDREAGENTTSASGDFAKKDPVDLFSEFYENVSGEEFGTEKRVEIASIFDRLIQKERIS